MKNAFCMRKGLLSAAFIMLSVFFVSISAQTYPALVSPAQATQILNESIPTEQAQLEQLNETDPAYAEQLRKVDLYVATFESVSTGASVEDALTTAFNAYAQSPLGDKVHEDELALSTAPEDPDYLDAQFSTLVSLLTL